jgi:LemA protein
MAQEAGETVAGVAAGTATLTSTDIGLGYVDITSTVALANAEGALQASLGRLMLVMERYPDVKASGNALQLQEELVSTENRIAFPRQEYNDAVMTYNTRLAVFPDVLVARRFSFAAAALFEAEASARALPNVDFSAPPVG